MTRSYLPRGQVAVRHRFTPLSVFPRSQQATRLDVETDLALVNPYKWLAEQRDLTMVMAPLPPGQRGRWYPELQVILISDRLSQAERRCTLAHELAHRNRGDIHMDDDLLRNRLERSCHEQAARWLIAMPALAKAMLESDYHPDIAEQLVVDVETLQARLSALHPSERGYLRRRLAMKEQTA